MSDTPPRIHALDSLRAVAMLLGLLIHGLNAYRTDFSYIWSVQDASRSHTADLLGHVIHAFRMPLFFILSGFFTRLVYVRGDRRTFYSQRFRRVVIPMLLGAFTLIPLSTLVGEFAATHAGPPRLNLFDANVWAARETLGHAAPAPADNPFDLVKNLPWPLPLLRYTSLGHLWFLYDLTVFFLLVPAAAGFLARRLGEDRLDAPVRRWLTGYGAALPLGLATLPLLYVQSLTLYAWAVGTQIAIFLPFPFFLLGFLEVNMLGYYLVFFAAGWLLQRQPDLIAAQTRTYGFHLLTGVTALTASFLLQERYLLDTAHPYHAAIRLAASLAYSCGGVALCLGSIGAFARWLPGESARWRYLADASYWIYLAHLPVVVILQLACTRFDAPWWAKVALVTTAASGVMLVTYALFVRETWIGRLLNGQRKRP